MGPVKWELFTVYSACLPALNYASEEPRLSVCLHCNISRFSRETDINGIAGRNLKSRRGRENPSVRERREKREETSPRVEIDRFDPPNLSRRKTDLSFVYARARASLRVFTREARGTAYIFYQHAFPIWRATTK